MMEDTFEFVENRNPWIVKDLQEFQSYHCSECEFKNVEHCEFIKHMESHECLEADPLNVQSFESLFYNCPECDDKSASKMGFIKHAVNSHEKSESLIETLNVSNEKKVQIIEKDPLEKESKSERVEITKDSTIIDITNIFWIRNMYLLFKK